MKPTKANITKSYLFISAVLCVVMVSASCAKIVPPQSNISHDVAIAIAQKWVDGAYGTKSENYPVNATISLFGNV
ncbi:MAG: hypothetical protein Q7R50_02780, partial [Dehalococcoidales bacterium]|nr:hypothetical protein [Dehalococcoidales bacterium]